MEPIIFFSQSDKDDQPPDLNNDKSTHQKKNPISPNNQLEIEIKCDLSSDEDCVTEDCEEPPVVVEEYGKCNDLTKFPEVVEECKQHKGVPTFPKKFGISSDVTKVTKECRKHIETHTLFPNQGLKGQQSINNISDTQTNGIVKGKSKANTNETPENRNVASTIPTEEIGNTVKKQKAEVKKTAAKSQLPKDKNSTHKSFQKEVVSNIKNLPRVEKAAVISILKEDESNVATSICKEDKSNVATRQELKHRCTLCDFQTSFRGKLSTHLISQHSGVRKEKERKNITEK